MRQHPNQELGSYLRPLLFAGTALAVGSCSLVSVDVRPNARTVEAGDTAEFAVFLNRRSDFFDPVQLDPVPASGLHHSTTLQPNPATGDVADLAVAMAPDAPIGVYEIDVNSTPATPPPWIGAPRNRAIVIVGPCGAEWIIQFGTADSDAAWSTTVNASGEIFAVLGSAGADDFAMRWEDDGGLRWADPIPPGGEAQLDVDPQGFLVVAARTIRNNMRTYLVRRYTPIGTLLWTEYFFDDPDALAVTDVATDADGNIYVVGITEGDAAGENPDTTFPFWDGWIAAFDSSGNRLWQSQTELPDHDSYENVAADGSGSVYVRGTIGTRTLLLRKFDAATGAILDSDEVQSYLAYRQGALAVDSSGNVLVAFHQGAATQPYVDPVLVKYDAALTQLWREPLVPRGLDVPLDMAIDGSDSPIVAGGRIVTVSATDAAVVKLGPDGRPQWNLLVDATFHTGAAGIDLDSAGDMYIAGNTDGSLAAQNRGFTDAWLARIRQGGCKL